MTAEQTRNPYISVVVTARNDDHGGGLLRRMQIFVTGFLNQTRRFGLNAELIIVEWNPPDDRLSLAEELLWNPDPGPCQVRIIQVPPRVHRQFQYSDKLPLFQMIAKNVGIRRARGEFVLATNIDVLFSDELFRFFVSGELNSKCMYRVDRYDVSENVPMGVSIQKQLEYCRRNVIRINRRGGTFTPEELSWKNIGRRLYKKHIADRLLSWLPSRPINKWDWSRGEIVRFLRNRVKRIRRWWWVQVIESFLVLVYRSLRAWLPSRPMSEWRWVRVIKDFLILVYRNLRAWLPSRPMSEWRHYFEIGRFIQNRVQLLRRQVRGSVRLLVRTLSFFITGVIRIPGNVGQWLKDFRTHLFRRIHVLVHILSFLITEVTLIPTYVGQWLKDFRAHPFRLGPVRLHTNACGDFTMLSKDVWFALHGYPEWSMYSFHIDSVGCHNADHAGIREVVLGHGMRIYHIEHGAGWKPDQDRILKQRMESLGVPMMSYEELLGWIDQMRAKKGPILFNDGNWGLGSLTLNEILVYDKKN